MKYFQSMLIDRYVSFVIHDDPEALRIIDPWNIEKEEIVSILVKHFHQLGIFTVSPLRHATLIHKDVIFLLRHSPELRLRLHKIREEIERTKARHSRHKA